MAHRIVLLAFGGLEGPAFVSQSCMSRHFSSKIFHEPCPSDSRTRDLFPLPTLEEPGLVQGNVCRAVRRRIHKNHYDMKRVNMAITSLNSLFFGGGKRVKNWSTGDLANLPICQRDSLRSIVQSIRAFGAPPPGASSSGALQALRTVSDGYSEPEIGVGAVCSMALDQLSLPSGAVAGVDLKSVLEEPLKSIVSDFEKWMLVDGDTWASVADEAMSVRTYNDPSLHHKKDYIHFLCHLKKCGILGLVSNCRGRVGAFTVTKKPKVVNGDIVKRQRLILDCRAVNYMFKEPPHTRLGSLAALTELELPTDERLFVSGSDIQDCFYAARLPSGMEECFCLHQDISLEEAVEIFGDDFCRYSHLERFIPCVTVLPMGFSWSFYIIQQLHEQASIRALKIDPQDLIKDGNPAPSLDKGSVLAMPYCDNVHCISTSREAADQGKELIAEELRTMGFSLHEDEDANTYFRTLGGVIDGEVGSIAPTREKAWNCILAFEFLLSNRVSCKLVQQLIGHSIVVFVLNRSGMCIFRRLYDFVQSDCLPRFLTSVEKEEVRNFIGLMPLLYGNIRLQWSDTVTCTDASPFGYGICERSAELQQVRNIGRWQERWRFKHLDPANWKPRERVQGRDVLGDIRTARCFPVPTCIDDLYELDGEFPEVPDDFMEPKLWHTVLMGRWNNTSEHITLKEGRSLVLAARRLSRASKSRGRRHLILVDSLALAMCSCKGRATNYGMLRVMQQLGALCLGGGFSIRLRWVISELNVADGPSRGQIKAGPFECGLPKTFEGSVFEGAAEPCDKEETSSIKQGSESSIAHCHGEEAGEDNDKGGEWQSQVATEQGNQDFSQSEHQQERGRNFGAEQPHDTSREVLGFSQHRKSVWGLLPEVSEFLPGSRFRSSTKPLHGCLPFRPHGCDFFLEGKPVNEGEKILASIEYHHSSLKGKLVRSRKALRGWRKERPQESRLPLPKLVAYGMSMHLLALGKRLQALKLILDFDTYMRPGESQDLVKKNLVIPVGSAGPQYKRYAVVIRDFEDGRPDKVGIYDNSVPLNTPGRQWLGPILHNHVKTLKSKEEKIFPFQSDEFRKDFTMAAEALGVSGLHPYQCRHGGASDDMSSKVRDFQSVKARGRWQTDQSVRRYTKIGKIQQLLNHLSKNKMAFCRWSHLNLEKAFKGLVPPRLS